MATLDTLRGELQDALVAAQPVSEGLTDYLSVNLTPEARQRVQEVFQRYQQRMAAINAALVVLEQLEATSYPADITQQVDDLVLADLQAQASTIQTALTKFSVKQPEAVLGTITITAADPVPAAAFDKPAKRR